MAVQTKFVGMMQYDGDLKLPARFLVPPPAISGVSGELLAKEGVTTFACSETQKFGHVSTLETMRLDQNALLSTLAGQGFAASCRLHQSCIYHQVFRHQVMKGWPIVFHLSWVINAQF